MSCDLLLHLMSPGGVLQREAEIYFLINKGSLMGYYSYRRTCCPQTRIRKKKKQSFKEILVGVCLCEDLLKIIEKYLNHGSKLMIDDY